MNRIEPGTLWPALLARARHALDCGAMQRIETTAEVIADAGVRFLVRRASSLARKDGQSKRTAQSAANPFLPHEPDLYVGDVSDTHIALLNKFNVVDNHLLIVTRRYVHQEKLLDLADFRALAECLADLDGLGFYNGGARAGASQPHKHLQLVPLPLASAGPPVAPHVGPPVPVEALFERVRGQSAIVRVPGLPFAHAFAWLDPVWFNRAAFAADRIDAARPGEQRGAGARLLARYRALYRASGLNPLVVDGEARQSAPYNLLLTRRWMLLVPRSKEHYDSISVNALGFAGSLFVRTEAQMRLVKRAGPMRVLREVAAA